MNDLRRFPLSSIFFLGVKIDASRFHVKRFCEAVHIADVGHALAFSPCGRRWPREASRMRGDPAWHRQHSVQHHSSVSALRADPPSSTGGEGKGCCRQERGLVFCGS
ncbi:MAG: hypothetical protein E5Y64_06545 [Mesorhizobium sp.]|nr:MAG: hypothetical protein E5Y70_02245 [Mesorhizobium sp.]TIM02090.1 MAG: hypothetical protein E5Y64_06545 [Mesorhizobium sp.]TIM36348.1 MAG: hypothetical protein E5Y61_04235 [Mesorhizobium sp.]